MLLLLANFGKDEKPEPMIAKISQETLAGFVGLSRGSWHAPTWFSLIDRARAFVVFVHPAKIGYTWLT